jgi:hypothetical protein
MEAMSSYQNGFVDQISEVALIIFICQGICYEKLKLISFSTRNVSFFVSPEILYLYYYASFVLL